jgi:serine/threonine protein kinase
MDSKIFLGKYRVAAEEMEAVGEIADSSLAYEAEEIDSGKKVVVEIVPAGSLKTAARDRLEAEAMAARKLSHINIPALCDFGVEDDRLVYVTEDFEGTPAEEWVNAHGPMPVGPVLRIASQVLSALGAAAIHQINHHAINPSNLVLVPGQTAEGDWPLVKVLHFVGVAPKTSGTDVAVAAFDKSLHYASPEQIENGTVDFRSELYSLGATMWFLLTGAPPLVAPAGPKAALPARI